MTRKKIWFVTVASKGLGLALVQQPLANGYAVHPRLRKGAHKFKMLFGISFGSADPDAPGNSIKLGRDPLSSNVTFHK